MVQFHRTGSTARFLEWFLSSGHIPCVRSKSPVFRTRVGLGCFFFYSRVPGGLALVGGPRAYRVRFRGSSLTECILANTFFLGMKIDSRKAREREPEKYSIEIDEQWGC